MSSEDNLKSRKALIAELDDLRVRNASASTVARVNYDLLERVRGECKTVSAALLRQYDVTSKHAERIIRLERELSGAKDHLNFDSELGKKYRDEIEDLKTHVLNLQKSIDILKTHASNLKATSDRWRENADNWKRNYYSVNREYTELRKQVDKAPKPGSTVNLTVNVDTEDALAKLNELLEVAKEIAHLNPRVWTGDFHIEVGPVSR